MTCKEIESNLPAYLEDALSPREKAVVDEHLASCAQCSKTLEGLKIMARLVREMEEVETPPWFTQKIMARVREVVKEKEGFFRKFFYPLHVKIPIQVLGTVLIAVIAFQIYRFGELETKVSVSPPASVLKTEKDHASAAAKPAETAPSRAKEEDRKQEKTKDMRVASAPSADRSEKAKQGGFEAAVEEKQVPSEKDEGMIGKHAPAKKQKKDARESHSAPVLKYKQEESVYSLGAVKESTDYAAPAKGKAMASAPTSPAQEYSSLSRAERIGVVVHVADVAAAAEEVEKLLGKYGARNIRKQFREDSANLTAELKPDNAADFLQKLKGVGKMEEQGALPGTRGQQYIPITIELRK